MDGRDLFGVSHEKLFYSKRIGNLYGGAKFHGRFGVFELSAMSNQAKKTDTSGGDSANFSVLRLKSHLGNSLPWESWLLTKHWMAKIPGLPDRTQCLV